MKISLIIAILAYSFLSYSQDWTVEQEKILTQFQIDKNDSRGLKLIPSGEAECQSQYESIDEALEAFFSPHPMKDVEVFCVDDFGDSTQVKNQLLDMHQIIELYIASKEYEPTNN